jgi:two-component system chemotaxis response regulator CheY
MSAKSPVKMLNRSLPALIVDDSRVMCEIMCKILKQVGFGQVEYTTEALEALSRLKAKRYGLLLTDLQMNPISGIDLIRLIWADSEIPAIPTIVTSADRVDIARTLIDAEREMADAYVLKPFTAETLHRKLSEVFGEEG